jgi:glycerate 2-kinase
MASGADIHAINALRRQLSALKGGKLARMCEAPVATMAISDVYDDDIAIIGSGPTIANRPDDRAAVIAPMQLFVREFARAFGVERVHEEPLRGSIEETGNAITRAWLHPLGPHVGWGEPTVEIPTEHGEGGRAQQLALVLARTFAGSTIDAFVIGSDGIDGPAPRGRPAPAGAFVDGDTWKRMILAGIDYADALARCDAGPALDAAGALIVTGPTGINHGDIMLVG